MLSRNSVVSWILVLSCFRLLNFAVPQVPKEEVDLLQQIVTAMGATFWKFNADLCDVEMVGVTQTAPSGAESYVDCDCTYENNTLCHVTKIALKSYNLPGILPPAIAKLPYLRDIDFAYNLLTGTIPTEWASTQLNFVSLLVNRLSGELPRVLGNITTLTYLNLEVNQFSGSIPSELGKLINLKTLILSSNQLSGNLPTSFSELINLVDFRINDNDFRGPIPDFIQNWKQLIHLEMHASGLEGPIPSNISLLTMLTALRISDIKGPTQRFPVLRSMTSIVTLVLRNCNISGEIPAYIWKIRVLQMLDVSFNNLVGDIPDDIARNLKVVFVTGNMLSGNIPDALLKDGSNIDLSYNNFTWKGPDQSACQSNLNDNVNLFKSSATVNALQQMLPCSRNVDCPRYKCSLHVNCGGGNLAIKESNRKVTYEGDAEAGSDSARFLSSSSYWGFTSSGEFMDLPNNQNSRSIKTTSTTNLSELYCTARLSPLSLTYYHYCLENGSYSVNLHFAEILFTTDNTYNSLGKRMFDIYIQEKLVWKDLNIEDEARGAQRPVTKQFNVTVSDNTLEIRFYWASKGTTRIPNKGDYGSLISSISVIPNFKICSNGGKNNLTVYVSVGVVAVCLIFSIFGFLWWKGCLKGRKRKDFEGLELQTVFFTLKQIKVATNNFDPTNKIGEGGFGPVYKGQLSEGTFIAVKQLSSKSRQGNREFLNEIGMISCLQHPNLVKLQGCCIDGEQLLLVYEYMENNSLAHVLFGSEESQLMLDWPARFKICLGIARGLAFLHEESRLKIVHRDIKATNVLLDGDLNPKISDFGLARLNEEEKTHISTRVAGTIGYMAPEYALWGYLTDKADVYSFGVVVLEIVSGKSNNNYMPSSNFTCLLDLACHLKETNNIDELLDKRLGSQVNPEEVEKMVKVAVLCTNATSSVRPTMSEVVQMLEGQMAIPDVPLEGNDVRFKTIKGLNQERQNRSSSEIQTQSSTTI
ncbi:putative LRR receptor-like serine/threonine-protein kinase RFK1 [Abeliophyllum distichum]|uniref:non-specific serine/threonine protein kinase n=1 Tax=Abeliophyllum distichum TaxID=126358 RepID=A0ABD1UGX7_9LAMI